MLIKILLVYHYLTHQKLIEINSFHNVCRYGQTYLDSNSMLSQSIKLLNRRVTMKKKIISILLALTLLISNLTIVSADSFDGDIVQIISNTFNNLDPEGYNLTKENVEESKTSLYSVDIENYFVNITGSIEFSVGNKKPFNLNGQLKSSESTENLLVGSLNDKNDNFEVVYFGISAKPSEMALLNKEIKQNIKSTDSILSIYLREKNTRNLTVVEVVQPEFINVKELFKDKSKLEKCEFIDQFWYAKILKPIKIEENDIDVSDTLNTSNGIGSDSISNNIQSPVVALAQASDTTYTYTYNVAGASVVESFKVRHYVDGPIDMYSQGSFVAKLNVIEEKTTCAAIPSMNSNDSNFSIGVYNDTKIDAYTSPGDYFQQVMWDGTYYKPGSVDIDVSWGYSLPTVGIGFAASYSWGQTFTNHTLKVFDNSGTTKVRQAGIVWSKSGHRLIAVGHTFDQSFTINKFSNPGTKYFNSKFTYDISNALDYGYGGIKTKTVTMSYNCK